MAASVEPDRDEVGRDDELHVGETRGRARRRAGAAARESGDRDEQESSFATGRTPAIVDVPRESVDAALRHRVRSGRAPVPGRRRRGDRGVLSRGWRRASVENRPRYRLGLQEGALAVMAAADLGLGYAGAKVYAGFRDGARFVVLLFRADSPELVAVIEADKLGQLRTGAASGVAAKYLARERRAQPRADRLRLAGGVAARAIRAALPGLERVVAYCRNEERLAAFCEEHGAEPGESHRDAGECDVVVTVTTSKDPVLRGEWLRPGALVCAVGANDGRRRELDNVVLERAAFVCCDSRENAQLESADLIEPVESGVLDWLEVHELQDVVAGEVAGRPVRRGHRRLQVERPRGVGHRRSCGGRCETRGEMTLRFGFTPCPNDAFAFHALAHGLVDAPFEVEPVLYDIEELNRRSAAGELELTKLSFGAAAAAGDRYRLLRSGAALGRGVGPLVVAREPMSLADAAGGRIAVPGRETTAFLLLRLAAPALGDVVELRYDEILAAVVSGDVDAGLIIHESRFTYARPRPRRGRRSRRVVGGRDRPAGPARGDLRAHRPRADVVAAAEAAIRASVEYAFAHPEASRDYVRSLAQEMSDEVCAEHIALYVNENSIDIGDEGLVAIERLLGRAGRGLDSPREPRRHPLRRSHADRPLRRRARGRPPRRSRGDRDQGGGRARGRSGGARSRTSGSAPRTRPARTTATSRAWRRCSRGFPTPSAASRSTGSARPVSRPSSAPATR